MKEKNVKDSIDAVVALHGLHEKMNFKRTVVSEFVKLAATEVKVKEKYMVSFIETNTNRIMNMCRAASAASGKEKQTWSAHLPWLKTQPSVAEDETPHVEVDEVAQVAPKKRRITGKLAEEEQKHTTCSSRTAS